MIKVLIIADDFTGALDAGIQFAKRGIATQVLSDCQLTKERISKTAQVLVIDSETRSLSQGEAYRIVKTITLQAIALAIPTIFKKTDSALRGNVGAELQAVADAVEGNILYFIPAFPEINRITNQGVHYIDGMRLEDSTFAKDPFEPVLYSNIGDLLKSQSDCHIEIVDRQQKLPLAPAKEKTIYVFDAISRQDMISRTIELKAHNKLTALAGCAGFAKCLAMEMELERTKYKEAKKTKGLYVACGSLHPVTRAQIETVEENGAFRINLTPEQKLYRGYYGSNEGKHFLQELTRACNRHTIVVADTFDLEEESSTLKCAQRAGILKEDIRYRISECHGIIIKALIEDGVTNTILMTGGDTLMGVMKVLSGAVLHLICEVERGAVVSRLEWNNKEIQIISKSGGFGNKNTICDIAEKIIERDTEHEICYDTGGMPGGYADARRKSKDLCC